jgi:general secretion pathway protein D
MVKAYQNNSNFKILSAPQILATDNEEANISVGEVVALPQGFTQDRDTGRFDLTNFKYEDVGIVLTLTPRVNSNELVTLKINQEIKKRQEENLYEFNVPVLTKRQMDTTISVPNHQTIVIGGLMREDKTKVVDRVPLLSNIPFIGEAFKNRRTITQKTNLLVFLTPHILSTPEELVKFDRERAQVSEEKRIDEIQSKTDPVLSNEKKRLREKARAAFDRLKSDL